MQHKVKLTSVGFVVVSFSHDDAQLNCVLKVLSLQTYLPKKGQETTSFPLLFLGPPHCLNITQNVAFVFLFLAFSINFCPIKNGLSGNTV